MCAIVAGGMGGAEADGQVPAPDLDATIDGAESRGTESSSPRPLPGPIVGAMRDYPELLEVDRGRYAIARELAKGGMGRVYEARDLRLGRQVAIKELLPKNRDIARRFEREARITARLQHPSIIHVYEAGVWPGGEPFYAMPVVAGRSLDKVVAEKATLADRLSLLPRVIAVADALAYAHNANVIHRDLKPANVLVGEFGETVVIDWGLAKDLGVQTDPKESMRLPARAMAEDTASGSVVGTPAYMPPEQARGDAVDQRADVYALGALLYKVLSGTAPYQGESASDVLAQVKAAAPVPVGERVPDAPPELVAIVTKAMAREPRDRYVSAAELAQDLKRFETGQLVGAHRYTAGQLVARWLRRYRVVVGTSAVALAVLAVVGVISVQNVVEARDRAEARRVALLEERGRTELLADHAGPALTYLVGAARDGHATGARQFLIAEALRPFEAQTAELTYARGEAVVVASPDGSHVVTAAGGTAELWSGSGARERVLGQVATTNVIAFDPGGTRVAAGGDDGVVRVWKLDGAELVHVHAHAGAVRDLAFSRDGRLATVGNDGIARVWDLARGTHVDSQCAPLEATALRSPLTTVRFDGLGLLAATGAEDGTGCVWQTFDGTVVTPLRGHTGAITAIRWSADLSWVATASADGTARVWSPYFGKIVVEPLRHRRAVTALEVTGTDSLISGDAGGVLHLWRLPAHRPWGDDGNKIVPIAGDTLMAGHGGPVVALALSADGALVASGGADRLTKLWQASTGQPIATFEQAEAITSVAFAGSTLATGSRDGSSRLWDTTAVKPREQVLDSPVHALAVSRAGVVAAGRDDSVISLVGTDATLDGHLGRVLAVAFTRDGKQLVSAGEDPAPIVWDVATRTAREPMPVVDRPGPLRSIATAPDGERFATAGADVRVWSLRTRSARVLDSAGAAIDVVAYAPTGDLLVGGGGGGGGGALRVWNGGVLAAQVQMHHAVTALAFAPDGTRLAIAGPAAVEIRAIEHGRIAPTALTTIDGSPSDVGALAFACGGACLVTGSDAGIAEVWDATSGKQLGTRDPHAGAISGLAVDASGTTLWIATEGNTVGAWQLRLETRDVAALACFVAARVPWRLGADDVVSRSEGGPHAERGSDCK